MPRPRGYGDNPPHFQTAGHSSSSRQHPLENIYSTRQGLEEHIALQNSTNRFRQGHTDYYDPRNSNAPPRRTRNADPTVYSPVAPYDHPENTRTRSSFTEEKYRPLRGFKHVESDNHPRYKQHTNSRSSGRDQYEREDEKAYPSNSQDKQHKSRASARSDRYERDNEKAYPSNSQDKQHKSHHSSGRDQPKTRYRSELPDMQQRNHRPPTLFEYEEADLSGLPDTQERGHHSSAHIGRPATSSKNPSGQPKYKISPPPMGKNRENSGSAKNNEEFEREQENNPKLSYYDDRDDWEKNKHHFRLVSFWEDGIKHEGVYNDRIIRPLYIAGWEGKIIDHGSEFGADIHGILFGARANEGRKPFDSKVGCTENLRDFIWGRPE